MTVPTHTYAVRFRKFGRDFFCCCLEHAIIWLWISSFASLTLDGLHRKIKPDISKETLVCKKTKVKAKKRLFLLSFSVPCQSVLTLTWRQQNQNDGHYDRQNRNLNGFCCFRSLDSAEVVEVNTTVITATSKLSELDLRTQSRGEFTLGNEFTSKESQCGIHPNFPAMNQLWLIPNIPTIMSQWTHRFCNWTLSWPFSTNYLRIVRLFIEAWKKNGPVCADKGRLIFHSGPQVLKLIFINLVWTWNRSF